MLKQVLLTFALFFALPIATAKATEICGNGIDDDSNGLTDEGCYNLSSNQCESPLSCSDTGMVSPLKGSLHYSLPPDIAPNVPWGPGIGFRRFYLSQYAPGGSAPAYRKPMGERWGNTYATWLDKYTVPNPDQVVVHTSRGQDVQYTYSANLAGWDYYTPQTGVHVQYLRQRVASPQEYQIKSLDGDVLVYNSSGRLSEIWDTLATANKVLLTYDGNGQVSTVTDASGKRRLLFAYTSSVLTSLKFQIYISSTWTDKLTTTYGYNNGSPTLVTIGGQYAQTNVYSNGYITDIKDGLNGNTLVSFVYDGTTAGKIVRVDTPRGVVGWEYNSSRTACSAKTVLYFHKGNSTACSIDSDCGSGFLCGGKTGTGSTGQCFRGARCMTVSSPSEDVVTTVTALGPPSESCDGACLDVASYVWNTGSGVLDLGAVQDPSGNYTASAFNTSGLPTTISYGDPDSNPSNSNGAREVFLTYDTNFPGRVAETRRKTEPALNATGGTCTPSISTECQRTLYTYNADGELATLRQIGHTLSATNGITGYDFTTTYSYDAQGKGRIAQIDGPLSGTFDSTIYEYWSSSDPLKDGFLQNFKRQVGPSGAPSPTYLTQSSLSFDFWGNATSLQDADGTVSCQTFDAARGFLSQRREQMNGQTDCTANSLDLVTSYTRDAALRLTQLTRPDGSCMIYEYDSRGRLSKTKRRDDCNAASSGDREEYTYSVEGLVTKIETFDSSSVVTKRQELTYFDSRRLEKIINPVNTAKWTGFTYDPRGMPSDIFAFDGTNNLNRTSWTFNADSRVDTEKRYTTTSAFDTWTLLFDWIGNQFQETDGDSKVTKSTRDDLGRVVKLESPDLGGYPTLRVYNEANRLVTIKETYGGTGELDHAFAFDPIGRQTQADYAGDCVGGGVHYDVPDIVRSYDALPTGISCPTGVGCNNIMGRLAYVKVKLMCAASAGTDGDWTVEQETFYSYDAAGRMIREYIQDDAASPGRVADHLYEWTKNGALSKVTTPSTAVIGWTFGSAGSNSDTDRITAMWRTSTSTPIADAILYEPYGPLHLYNQQNTVTTLPLRTVITHNLAYRITKLETEAQSSPTLDVHYCVIGEDDAGRVKKRDYIGAPSSIQDSYFQYDLQDRVLCETTTSQTSCPTSGSTIKNSHTASPPFTAAGDWKTLLRPIPGSTGLTHAFSDITGTHQINHVNQSDGTPVMGTTDFSYDARGDRSIDDNKGGLTNDDRTYSYDSRRNVTNVRGQYKTGGAWHFYDVASAFDARNRRVFKSFYDETSTKLASWYFYYDPMNRLTEIRYTPDTSVATTYTLFQLFWLGDRLVLYWQTDYPAATTSKRYVHTDETSRPIDMMSWPPATDGTRIWTINTDAWGDDRNLVGPSVFQPIKFAGQYEDSETVAWQNDGLTVHRPGVVLNGYRTYDPFVGSYLQVDPMVDSTWSTYVYVNSDPVGKRDPDGEMIGWDEKHGQQFGDTSWGDCYDWGDIEGLSACLGGYGLGDGLVLGQWPITGGGGWWLPECLPPSEGTSDPMFPGFPGDNSRCLLAPWFPSCSGTVGPGGPAMDLGMCNECKQNCRTLYNYGMFLCRDHRSDCQACHTEVDSERFDCFAECAINGPCEPDYIIDDLLH